MTNLKHVLPDYPEKLPELHVPGMKLDSRRVAQGDLFVAIPGYQVDGRDFIDAAIAAGAGAVIQEADACGVKKLHGTPVISVPGLREQLSGVAGRFFGHPSRKMRVIGVTGTNGKTTVSQLVAQLWQYLEPPAAVLGTLGSGLVTQMLPEQNTTPDAVTVQQRLAGFAAEGVHTTAMEVSSHAMVQYRVEAVKFDTLIATNISRDHLDYHGTMDAYIAAKKRLFDDFTTKVRIFNADDKIISSWGDESDLWFSMDESNLTSVPQKENTLLATSIKYTDTGTEMDLHWQGQTSKIRSPLLGDFNISNLLAALLSPLSHGYALSDLVPLIRGLKPVAGRMETFSRQGMPLIIVDYAHTPDALQQVLSAARRHCKGQLWCVFGCGGDRDRGKRPQMGQVAAAGADQVVVTDDNPRTEDPLQIIEDIVSGMTGSANIIRMPGRQQAVTETINKAATDDVVVLAGKGHETYQIIGTKSVNYDERAVVASLTGGRCA